MMNQFKKNDKVPVIEEKRCKSIFEIPVLFRSSLFIFLRCQLIKKRVGV